MNTVGKHGQLGGPIRCVVSVSMLTEGWDANTVTHILGVRAFGTQLLCEQVIGRALRRQSYDQNEAGLFDVEYADILGVPFDFTAKPVVAPPQPPRETVQVNAVSPDRDALEIRFPHVEGYRVELPDRAPDCRLQRRLHAWNSAPDLVGPSITRNSRRASAASAGRWSGNWRRAASRGCLSPSRPRRRPLIIPTRRFRVMGNVEELERALDFPWEKWTVFLHPDQRELVEREYNGPARVSGSAGTGKTIVALHRVVYLARHIQMPACC